MSFFRWLYNTLDEQTGDESAGLHADSGRVNQVRCWIRWIFAFPFHGWSQGFDIEIGKPVINLTKSDNEKLQTPTLEITGVRTW